MHSTGLLWTAALLKEWAVGTSQEKPMFILPSNTIFSSTQLEQWKYCTLKLEWENNFSKRTSIAADYRIDESSKLCQPFLVRGNSVELATAISKGPWCQDCGLYPGRITYICRVDCPYTSGLLSLDNTHLVQVYIFSWIIREIYCFPYLQYSRALEVQKKYILFASWPYGFHSHYLCIRIFSEEG